MFTRLEVKNGNTNIIFHAHEMIALMLGFENNNQSVPGLIHEVARTRTFIPKQGDFSQYRLKYMQGTDHDFLFGKYDTPLFMPMHVEKMSTSAQYYYVTMQLHEYAQQISLQGWWLFMGGRLLYLRNKMQADRFGFYISDFGDALDVFDGMKRVILESPWLENYDIPKSGLFNNASSSQTLSEFQTQVANAQLDVIHEHYPSRSPNQLYSMVREIETNDQYSSKHFETYYQQGKYIQETLKPIFTRILGNNPPIVAALQQTYPHNPRIVNHLMKCLVSLEIMEEVNQGNFEHYFKPNFAFSGDNITGATYKEFADEIELYLAKTNETPAQLAAHLRAVLQGEEIMREDLAFLPNLAAAWFVGEPIRNLLTIPTGSMLLDFLENPQWLQDESQSIKNLYTWRHVFLHPLEGGVLPQNFVDLYNEPIQSKRDNTPSILYFRGTHPMVHLDSTQDAKSKLGNKQKLSRARQKEASLIIHWLAVQLKKLHPDYEIRAVQFDPNDKNTFLVLPNYDEISTLTRPSNKAQDKISKQEGLKLKHTLLHEDILKLLNWRCNTLANGQEYFYSVKNSEAVMQQVSNAIIPVAPRQPDFETSLPTGRLYNFYEAIFEATKNRRNSLFSSAEFLQTAVATHLFRNKAKYQLKVKVKLIHLASADVELLQTLHYVIGFAQMRDNPGFYIHLHLPSTFSGDPKSVEASKQRSIKSGLEAAAPKPPLISNSLYQASKQFEAIVLCQLSDAVWFKKKISFLKQMLSVPHLSLSRHQQIVARIISLQKQAKIFDAIYDRELSDEMENKNLYDLYCDSARILGRFIPGPELEVLAEVFKLEIVIFRENKNESISHDDIYLKKGDEIKTFSCAHPSLSKKDEKLFLFNQQENGYSVGKRLSEKNYYKAPTPIDENDGLIVRLLKSSDLFAAPLMPAAIQDNMPQQISTASASEANVLPDWNLKISISSNSKDQQGSQNTPAGLDLTGTIIQVRK